MCYFCVYRKKESFYSKEDVPLEEIPVEEVIQEAEKAS